MMYSLDSRMGLVPVEFSPLWERISRDVKGVAGWLSPREAQFLALLAACPTAQGDVLEIGSFRGRSTIVLAHAILLANRTYPAFRSQLVAVDPLRDDDALLSQATPAGTAMTTFEANLQRAGVRAAVEFHRGYSYELAVGWQRKLRLLWIDGDHSYASSKQDFDLFHPHLTTGGILAMHDVLSRYDGCLRVFLEYVLPSPHFGACGLCGSIGWAQYLGDATATRAQQRAKESLMRKLLPLLPFHQQSGPLHGWQKLKYQWLRARVPHQAVTPAAWEKRLRAA